VTPPPDLPVFDGLRREAALPPLSLDDLLFPEMPDTVPSWHEFLNAEPGEVSACVFDVMLSRDLDADEYLAFMEDPLDG